MTEGQSTRVMIVDDHEIVRQGVATVLRGAGIDVCSEASTLEEAVTRAEATQPDVVVMDVRLAGGSGIEATREIRTRRPDTRVLMLTSFADEDALFASIMAGASGYILKQVLGMDLVDAVRRVADGQSLLDPAVTSAVLERLRQGGDLLKDEKLARLSSREERILDLVAAGRTNRQIAEELYVSEKTVKNNVSTILSKLEVTRRAEAVAYLSRHRSQT